MSQIWVSPSSREGTSRDTCLILHLVCLSQFGGKIRALGTYELEEDAARAFDKVARILGRSEMRLNFPNSDALEITGPRSEGADESVAATIRDARTFVATGGNNQRLPATSSYMGVLKKQNLTKNQKPWMSQIKVRSRNVGCI